MAPEEFRWHDWNLEHASQHGFTVSEIESVVRNARARLSTAHRRRKVIGGRPGPMSRMKTTLQRRSAKMPIASEKDMTATKFEALSDAEKEKIFQEIEQQNPAERLANSQPLNAVERARWGRFKKKIGRPKVGKGVQVISLSVEKDLLKRADAYAHEQGMSRAQLVAKGLLSVMGE